MALKCVGCGYSKFQFSKLRLGDLGMLLTFRYPVRCHGCLERYYIGFLDAWELHRERRRKRAERLRKQREEDRQARV